MPSPHSRQLQILFLLALGALNFIDGVEAQSSNSTTSDDPQSTKDSRHIIAGYIPKKWASVIAIVAYALSGIIHWIHYFRIGKRHMLTLTIAMSFMVLGFILRIVYSGSPYSLGLYIIMTMCILLSPCAFLAVDYILLEHLAETLGHEVAQSSLFLSSSLIVKIFVSADVITFLLQAAGGGLQASENVSSSNLGKNIAIIGLVIQLVSFGLFTCLLLVFGFRVRTSYVHLWRVDKRGQTITSTSGLFKVTDVYDWKILFFILCVSCVCILIRSAFRIFEYAQGFNGFLSTHEGYFYLLDAFPLWLAMTQFCFFWPSRFNGPAKETTGMKPSQEWFDLDQNRQVHA